MRHTVTDSQLCQAKLSTGQLKIHLFILLKMTDVNKMEIGDVAGKLGDEKCSLKLS